MSAQRSRHGQKLRIVSAVSTCGLSIVSTFTFVHKEVEDIAFERPFASIFVPCSSSGRSSRVRDELSFVPVHDSGSARRVGASPRSYAALVCADEYDLAAQNPILS